MDDSPRHSIYLDDRLEVDVVPEFRDLILEAAGPKGIENFIRDAVIAKMRAQGRPAYRIPPMRNSAPQAGTTLVASFPKELKQAIGFSGPGEKPLLQRFIREALAEHVKSRGVWIRASRYDQFVSSGATA
jgi:hypothetical protein